VDTLQPWVKKAIPVLRVGLVLLQLGLSVASVPIPVAGLANDAINQATKNQFLKCAIGFLNQQGTILKVSADALSNTMSRAKDFIESEVDSKVSVGQEVVLRNLHLNDSNTRSAYESIKSFLEQSDPTLQYLGLEKQVSKSGKVAWIKKNDPEILKQFMDSDGANMP